MASSSATWFRSESASVIHSHFMPERALTGALKSRRSTQDKELAVVKLHRQDEYRDRCQGTIAQ
jgi:hypothetical protein